MENNKWIPIAEYKDEYGKVDLWCNINMHGKPIKSEFETHRFFDCTKDKRIDTGEEVWCQSDIINDEIVYGVPTHFVIIGPPELSVSIDQHFDLTTYDSSGYFTDMLFDTTYKEGVRGFLDYMEKTKKQ